MIKFYRNGINDEYWRSGKSGPIKCDKGFKVRFDLVKPVPGSSNWNDTYIILADSKIPADQLWHKADSLDDEEDSSVHVYGVCRSNNYPCNLKKDSSTGKQLPHSSPITMEYDRMAQTVRFKSSEFTYSQTGLPKDITFAIGVTLGENPQEMDVTFLSIT